MRTALIIAGLILTLVFAQGMGLAATAETAEKGAAPAPVTAPVDLQKKSDNYYEYTGASRRDPFTSLIQKKASGKIKGQTPLESYETTDMKLIAIMWANNRYYGVLSMPDKKSYTVHEGMKVGVNAGVIKKISKDTMIIADRIKDARGRFSPKERVLKLRTEEE
jgi:Tfp pilus assembly protein PilP